MQNAAKAQKAPSYSKFRNKPTTVDGIRFASKLEAKRYGELKLLERAGAIRGLELQPRFKLSVDGHLICEYRGDFGYHEKQQRVVEDTKGYCTPDYIIKAKLMRAIYPHVELREMAARAGRR